MSRLVALILCLLSCQSANDFIFKGPKLKGVNLVAPPQKPLEDGLKPIREVGVGWVAIVPYGFCRKDEAHFHYFGNRREQGRGGQWWGETPTGVIETIQMARRQGLKVMLKPHVWMMGGSHLDLEFTSEQDWQSFETDYSNYILDFARLADSLKVDLYCITTELDRFAVARPNFWKKLIHQVHAIYKGPLTYAANWDRFEKIPFWEQLDYIGIDAYFPTSDDREPSIRSIARGWKRHINTLADLSNEKQKPILFTEFGYRACDHAAEKPWESETPCTPNQQAQANAYSALMETVWPQPWFAGGFVWKWFMHDGHRSHERDQFSPQGRQAEAVLRAKWTQ